MKLKNGSVVRTLLGEGRLDIRELDPKLRRLYEDYSGYRNFRVPYKMFAAKVKRKDVKNALQRCKTKINGIELYHRILKRLRRIRRLQRTPKATPRPLPLGLSA